MTKNDDGKEKKLVTEIPDEIINEVETKFENRESGMPGAPYD